MKHSSSSDAQVLSAASALIQSELKRAGAGTPESERRFRELIEALPAAIYTTDAEGRLTHFNSAAVAFSGRLPQLGSDRWCVSWKLYRPDGTILPHGECPMAVALQEGRAIEGEEAIAERPDGSRIWFAAYPTPLRDSDGRVVGGVNMLVDITERKRSEQARAQLAAIVESSDDAIVSKSLEGVIATWNPAAERMFGYTAEQAIGQSITILIPPDRLDEEATILGRIRSGERVDHYETVRRHRDGALLDVSITVSPVVDGQGRIVGASKIARDVTDRKLAENARLEDARIRETLANVGASLAAELDEDKLVQAVTDAGTTLTGAGFGAFFHNVVDESGECYRLHTLSGAPREAFGGNPKPLVTAILGPTFRGEGPVRIDDVLTDPRYGQNPPYQGLPPGHLPVRSCLAVPVVSRSGQVLGGLFFAHSLPARFLVKHEQLAAGIASWAAVALDNARLYKEAQEANRVKDEFLAMLSHELRTPLNAMLGWAHMLRSAALPPDTQRRALESLERNARAQAQLVEDLLDVSRVASGKLQINSEEVDLTRIALEALDSIRPAGTAKGLKVQAAVDSSTRVMMIGDPDRLRQVIWNLLSNAVKFTPPGGEVVLELRHGGASAEVIVRDTGEGIPDHFLPLVFDRFRQAHSTTSRRHGGLGLGLAIVRHLTEAHGGRVAADSAGEGRGATFTVTLPIAAVRPLTSPVASAPQPAGTALEGTHVLVVDDESDARDLARIVLELQGAHVTTVASAGEALHTLSALNVDVLIADIGMPDQDGYSLIHAIRALGPEQGGRVPAIALTAYASVRERAKALEAGYGWHIAKPLDADQLIAAVLAARCTSPARTQGVAFRQDVQRHRSTE